jgi:hypothetical protein
VRPEVTALLDQAGAASGETDAIMAALASLEGTSARHVHPGPVYRTMVTRLTTRALTGGVTLCPDLSYDAPQPSFWCAWAPRPAPLHPVRRQGQPPHPRHRRRPPLRPLPQDRPDHPPRRGIPAARRRRIPPPRQVPAARHRTVRAVPGLPAEGRRTVTPRWHRVAPRNKTRYVVVVRIGEPARKHGIADADIRHAIRHATHKISEDDSLTMLIGPDSAGAPLEVGVLDAAGDDPVVIHAMPLRPKFYGFLR